MATAFESIKSVTLAVEVFELERAHRLGQKKANTKSLTQRPNWEQASESNQADTLLPMQIRQPQKALCLKVICFTCVHSERTGAVWHSCGLWATSCDALWRPEVLRPANYAVRRFRSSRAKSN